MFEPPQSVPREFQKVRVTAFPTNKRWPHGRGRRRHVVAARRNSVLVGFALLFVDTEEGDADLNDLAVRSNQQRAGVGYAVCADAVDWMRELDAGRSQDGQYTLARSKSSTASLSHRTRACPGLFCILGDVTRRQAPTIAATNGTGAR